VQASQALGDGVFGGEEFVKRIQLVSLIEIRQYPTLIQIPAVLSRIRSS
jgi:hypothetical protein